MARTIVDRCRPATCARKVGTYYSVRSLLVVPGGLICGLLWQRSPALDLEVMGALSAVGLLVFAMMSRHSEWRSGIVPHDAATVREPLTNAVAR